MNYPTTPHPMPHHSNTGRVASAVGILGTGSYLPDRVVTNHEIARTARVDEEWIQRKTGITERPHQANKVMIDELFPALGLPFATLHETAPSYGNTASASVPLTLDIALQDGKITAGETVLLAALGGGMSIGLALIQ